MCGNPDLIKTFEDIYSIDILALTLAVSKKQCFVSCA